MKIDARKHQKGLQQMKAFLVTAASHNKQLISLGIAATLLLTLGTASALTFKTTHKTALVEPPVSTIQTMVVPQVRNDEASKSILVKDLQAGQTLDVFNANLLPEQVSLFRTVGFKGTLLTVSNQAVGFFRSAAEAEAVLSAVKTPFVKDTLQDLYFKETVLQESHYVMAIHFEGFSSTDAALNLIKSGSEIIKTYVVKEGENLWGISKTLNVTLEDILAANPTLVPEKVKAGQTLNLNAKKSLITVCTIETVKSVDAIPFTVSFKDNQKLFKGETKILTAGVDGKKAVEAKLYKENGILMNKEILSEVVLNNAKSQVVSKGTKAKLTASASGKLAKPFSRGTFSSPFGRRWGKLHKGNDFSMSVGSNILSAESGRVEKVSFEKNGYGLHVIVNHGNGLKTVYAHCSKVLVNEGDRVTISQKIALSGQTGRAYNPHLHFEVYKNGVAVDPMKYLLIKK